MTRISASVPGGCAYDLDARLRLVAVDDRWKAFAEANDAPELVPPGPIGRYLVDAIADEATAHLYEELFHRVAANGRTATVAIRCDSPVVRRYLDLTIRRREDGFRVETAVTRVETSPGGAILQRAARRSDQLLRMCSWCKRVDVSGIWQELDIAVERLRLFERDAMPQITHAMCAECYARVEATLEVV